MYLKQGIPQGIPQSEPLPDAGQVPNEGGGYVWPLDDWKRLERFLVLGSEGGTYYASERKLTEENASCVRRCLALDGLRTVEMITQVSQGGRAPKNDAALFALAMAMSYEDGATKLAAAAALPKVARIGTHLYHFAAYLNAMRGWGRSARRAISEWFDRAPDALAYQMVKYQQRDGWAGRDLLRLAHPKYEALHPVFRWMCGRGFEAAPQIIKDFEAIAQAADETVVLEAVERGFPWEAIPSPKRTDKVWAALVPHLGLTALIRNLGNLSKRGVLSPALLASTCRRLTSVDQLRAARVHPIQLLSALLTYQAGRGVRSASTWPVEPTIVTALENAFYLSFGLQVPTGKRLVLALDVSGSMQGGTIAGVPNLTPHIGAAALAMQAMRTESAAKIIAFSDEMVEVFLGRDEALAQVSAKLRRIPMGSTDCALPMLWALRNRIEADAFIIYTDSETWAGKLHPAVALQNYRRDMGIKAQLIVVGMTSNGFSIADPRDAGMLDVVGFDTATPQLIASFVGQGFLAPTVAEASNAEE